jgi:hypothetical protein
MAAAYNILGLRPHHALDMVDQPEQWKRFEAAADGTFPDPNTGALRRARFSRQEWDQIYGKYGAITELGSVFAEQLIAASVVAELPRGHCLAAVQRQAPLRHRRGLFCPRPTRRASHD